MKILNLVITVLIVNLNLLAQQVDKKELRNNPKNLDEAIIQLDKLFHDTTKNQFKTMTENEFLANSHFSTGRWIRNNWKLWKGADLTSYFNSIGIYHPDDMSGIILRSYYRHLNNKDFELDKQVQFYQEYWKKVQEHAYKMETDTSYARQIEIENELNRKEYYKKIKEPYTPGTRVFAWVDYSIGMINDSRTKIIGEILEWDENIALVKVIEYLDPKKKNKVIQYNKMKDDILKINIDRLELWK